MNDLFSNEKISSVDNKFDCEQISKHLTEMELKIVYLYAYGYTQQEIGDKVGYHRANISKILSKLHKKHYLFSFKHRGN